MNNFAIKNNNFAIKNNAYFLNLPYYVLVVGAAMLFYLTIVGNGAWEGASVPALLAALLTAYLAFEVRREVNARGALALFSPAVLASFIHFALGYSLPVGKTFFDDFVFESLIIRTGDADFMSWLTYTVFLVLVSAIVYWRGYRANFAKYAADFIASMLIRTRVVRAAMNIRISAVIVLCIASVVARFVQIKLGVFGFASDPDALLGEYAQYRTLLDYGVSGGRLALFLIAFQVARLDRSNPIGWRLALAVMFTSEVFFAFLSGFKGQTVFCVLVVLLAYYFARSRISVQWSIGAVVILFAAYSIIEPFRDLRNTNFSFNSRSFISIAETLIEAATTPAQGTSESTLQLLSSRTDSLTPAVVSIWFRGTNQSFGDDTPAFLSFLILSPIYAFIPRIVWAGKPFVDNGRWFSQRVYGGDPDGTNSVAMGATGYFYLAGGFPIVVIGFFGLGLLHRILFESLTAAGAGGWLMYFSLLLTLAVIPSEVAGHISSLFQMVVVTLAVQALVLKA